MKEFIIQRRTAMLISKALFYSVSDVGYTKELGDRLDRDMFKISKSVVWYLDPIKYYQKCCKVLYEKYTSEEIAEIDKVAPDDHYFFGKDLWKLLVRYKDCTKFEYFIEKLRRRIFFMLPVD